MAYNKNWNPDALPAHAEPEQAAQVLSQLQGNRRPSPSHHPASSHANLAANRPSSPSGRRYSPNHNQQSLISSQSQPVQNQHQKPSYSPSHSYLNTPASGNPPSYNVHNNSRIHSPPPQNYGYGPRPSNPVQHRPYIPNQPPRTPAPPPDADSADLFPLFRAANASQSGALSEGELGSALVNADYTAFDPYTIKMMMRMFSSSPNKDFVSYDEFVNLWRFLAAWRELFERFDEDRSGRISLDEFSNALVAFGYRLSPSFIGVLYNAYTERGMRRRGSRPAEGMSFDLFVQACISLKRMTDVFKGYDEDRDGYVTLSFEEFLTEILKLRE